MISRNVLVMSELPFDDSQWSQLYGAFEPDSIVRLNSTEQSGITTALETAEIAILAGDLDERHIHAPKLKWVHCDHAGLTKSARPEVFKKGMIVTGSAGRNAPALAEHAMMFALMLTSRYSDFYEAQKLHEWRRDNSMLGLSGLYGKTIGIVGMGHTGSELAARAKAFHMRVLSYRRRNDLALPNVDQTYSSEKGEGLDLLLSESDVVVLAISLSDVTRHLIKSRELALMKSSSVLINMSRGEIIDQPALIQALKSGIIAGAALDVTTPEPLPHDHELWETPNLLITPHFTPSFAEKSTRSLAIITDNILRFRKGEAMLNRLNLRDVYSH
jgi:phosphoglycerate dehydrogenase-like enzyme